MSLRHPVHHTHHRLYHDIAHAKEPYKRDYILQKRPIILRSLLIVANPYIVTPPPGGRARARSTRGSIENVSEFVRHG